MLDEEFEKLILSGTKTKAKISKEKLEAGIKNVVQRDIKSSKKAKSYVKVAKELALRVVEKGFTEEEILSSEKLTDLEKKAIQMVRNDSNRDIEHLKGDLVVSSFVEVERVKRNHVKPPQKRLQLSDKQLQLIFKLKSKKTPVLQISKQLGLNRGTVIKVLNKDYLNQADIKRIEHAERDVGKKVG